MKTVHVKTAENSSSGADAFTSIIFPEAASLLSVTLSADVNITGASPTDASPLFIALLGTNTNWPSPNETVLAAMEMTMQRKADANNISLFLTHTFPLYGIRIKAQEVITIGVYSGSGYNTYLIATFVILS